LDGRKGIQPVKNWWSAGVVISLVRDLYMAQLMPLPLTVSCFSTIQIGFTFLVLAHPGTSGQRVMKRVCVCVYGDSLNSTVENSSVAGCRLQGHAGSKTLHQQNPPVLTRGSA